MDAEQNGNVGNQQNSKLQIVKEKNQIDFFMNNYAVYKKGGIVVMKVVSQTEKGPDNQFYELTQEEYDSDEFRSIANNIRKNPQNYESRRLL